MRCFLSIVGAFCALLAMSSLSQAKIRIDVDLSAQTMRVAAGDGETYVWPISSGRAGHLTPRGRFQPQRLYPIVYSAKYNNAPMPHSIFFHGQFAIHGTNAVASLGRPASHGCIRLAPANAATLFAMVSREGASISIVGDAPTRGVAVAKHHKRDASALAFAPRRHVRTLKEWSADPLGAD